MLIPKPSSLISRFSSLNGGIVRVRLLTPPTPPCRRARHYAPPSVRPARIPWKRGAFLPSKPRARPRRRTSRYAARSHVRTLAAARACSASQEGSGHPLEHQACTLDCASVAPYRAFQGFSVRVNVAQALPGTLALFSRPRRLSHSALVLRPFCFCSLLFAQCPGVRIEFCGPSCRGDRSVTYESG